MAGPGMEVTYGITMQGGWAGLGICWLRSTCPWGIKIVDKSLQSWINSKEYLLADDKKIVQRMTEEGRDDGVETGEVTDMNEYTQLYGEKPEKT